MNFGEKLKLIRQERGINQQRLANDLKIGRSTVSGYESNNNQPDFEKLIQIADYFDVSIDYLLGRTEKSYPISRIENLISLDALSKEQISFIDEYIKFSKYINKKTGTGD